MRGHSVTVGVVNNHNIPHTLHLFHLYRPYTSQSLTMRLPYVPEDPKLLNPDDQAVVERVKERRGGKLIALDRALLHAPPVADGWYISRFSQLVLPRLK